MRDVASLAAAARRHGDAIGVYADRLLDTDLPWTKMRQVYRLLGLVRRYGPGPVDTACQRALDLDVINVTKIASMLEKATENTPLPPRPAVAAHRPVRPRPGRVPARAADAHPRREGGRPVTAAMPGYGQPGPARHAAGAQARPDARHPARPAHPGPAAEDGPRRLPRARPRRRGHPPRSQVRRAAGPRRRPRSPGCGWTPGTPPPRSATTTSCGTSWLSLRFLDGPHGALILGPVGVGKTHLACALGHIAVRRRRTVHMAPAAKLFKRLKAARLDNTLDAEMRRLAGTELLILDDFALQPLDATETADFYQLCVERHQRASTVVTSNRTPRNGWP